MRIAINYFAFLLLISLFSCETREIEPKNVDLEMGYYPLQKGVYVIYKVNEKNYNLIQGNQTKDYFLKEVITDSVLSSGNSFNYIINRFKRNTANEDWKLDSVWTARIQDNQIIKVENNVPFVKLVFPVVSGKIWNGNAYNIRGEELYLMDSVHKQKVFNNIVFDSTLVQWQKKDSSSISQDYRMGVYAKGVGMIYKKSIITSNLQKDGSIVFPIQIDRGIDLTQTVIEYGKE